MLKGKIVPWDKILKENAPQVRIDKEIMDEMVFIAVPIGLIVGILIIGLSIAICRCKKVRAKLIKTKESILWNGILRSIVVGYLGYATTVSTSLPQLSLQSSPSKLITAACLTSLVLFFPIWMRIFIGSKPIAFLETD